MNKKILIILLCLILAVFGCIAINYEPTVKEDENVNEEVIEEDVETDEEVEEEEDEEESSPSESTDSSESKSSSSKLSNSNSDSSNNSSNSSSSTSKKSTTEVKETSYCTYTISCSNILNHDDVLTTNYQIPSNGLIYSKTMEIEEGDTVLSLLKKTGVTVEVSGGYVRGIDNLYEFDCGDYSGWMYAVNGVRPNTGAGNYSLENGDSVEWIYVVDKSEW